MVFGVRAAYQVITNTGIVGTIYIPKDIEAMPEKLILEYADKKES